MEPTCFTMATKNPKWRAAVALEFDALQLNGTWSLVPAKPNMNIVGCKWVYKLNYNADGSIDRYKARLVAKGFHQQEGVDFTKTFSPIAKPTTIRIVLSLTVRFDGPLRQLDINNAFLSGGPKEKVYMHQPQGFVITNILTMCVACINPYIDSNKPHGPGLKGLPHIFNLLALLHHLQTFHYLSGIMVIISSFCYCTLMIQLSPGIILL